MANVTYTRPVTYTRAEKALRRSLNQQIAVATNEITRERLRQQLQDVREGAIKRCKERERQKAATPVTVSEDFTPEEKQRQSELLAQIEAETDPDRKAELQAELDDLVDAVIERYKKAYRTLILSGAHLAPPEKYESQSEESFEEEMAWYRLDLAEAACYRKLNSPESSIFVRRHVDTELKKIEKQRRELRPEEFEPEPATDISAIPEAPPPLPSLTVSVSDLRRISTQELKEMYCKEKYFTSYVQNREPDPELLAMLESEFRRRKQLFVRSVEGTYDYVDEAGSVVSNLNMNDAVIVGSIPNPNPNPPIEPEKPAYKSTHAQREAWKDWRNQYTSAAEQAAERRPQDLASRPIAARPGSLAFIYRLLDGTLFWSWDKDIELQHANVPVPRDTRVLAASDPPGYLEGSHEFPGGYFFDAIYSVWRKV